MSSRSRLDLPEPDGWELKLRDGTVYHFPDYDPLKSITDRFGNKLTITRSAGDSGNVTQLTTESGRWIKFTYDNSSRIVQAADNAGRTVSYAYDAAGRLERATDANGGATTYAYDAAGLISWS